MGGVVFFCWVSVSFYIITAARRYGESSHTQVSTFPITSGYDNNPFSRFDVCRKAGLGILNKDSHDEH